MAVELACSAVFFLPMTVGVTNVGAIFGAMVFLACLAVTAFFRQIKKLIRALWTHKAWKIAIMVSAGILGLLVLYACFLTVLMLCAANAVPKCPDTVIVLGCKVQPDGNPSLMLRKRIEAAYGYLEKNSEIICIVSGGKGDDEPISEAETMKSSLIEMGIDTNRILIEDKSVSTRENIEFSLKLLEEKGISVSEAAIITDGFHQFRASLIAKENGIESTAVSADTPKWLLPAYWFREWFALSHRFVFGS